ncbi:hypothetical protein E0H75_13925 [Kribbella capetownensis]|uniref:Uncharacterized protein n=1 Tax=Kribbella capetownensis TaxID=1572659 RepID=A0A4R0K7X8_9ACTN|nr:hypothetical protein [Kribbella capetownensis]TCC51215.1 hypothetical protein E0H75_13925 [Kribbella capetownensis]
MRAVEDGAAGAAVEGVLDQVGVVVGVRLGGALADRRRLQRLLTRGTVDGDDHPVVEVFRDAFLGGVQGLRTPAVVCGRCAEVDGSPEYVVLEAQQICDPAGVLVHGRVTGRRDHMSRGRRGSGEEQQDE